MGPFPIGKLDTNQKNASKEGGLHGLSPRLTKYNNINPKPRHAGSNYATYTYSGDSRKVMYKLGALNNREISYLRAQRTETSSRRV